MLVIMARLGIVRVTAPQLRVELSFALRMTTLNICLPPGQPVADWLDGKSSELTPKLRRLSIRVEPIACPNSFFPVTSICTSCSIVDDTESFSPASLAVRFLIRTGISLPAAHKRDRASSEY